MTTRPDNPPRHGMFALVRNRRGVITAVEPSDGESGRLHLVHIEYKDDQHPVEEKLLWEIEPHAVLLEPTALPNVGKSQPMPPEDFDAVVRATRWSATAPFLDPDGSGPLERLPISSPFHGAVQVEDFQLVPLLKALRMPRVNLLIADDVGLGKTIEAGLIMSELLIRRRIQRVLILTPASLRDQWREEMWEKFSLAFDTVDRAETDSLRRRLGMDANPWRASGKIICSYHYLRQPDVLEQFLAACRIPEGSPHFPWDLLIVDECHNLMPSAFGDDSDLTLMLRLVAPHFEHRIFMSATPHNGHTRCFTGLLEILDPVRFSQTSELKPAERERIQQVVIRRLKREINARTSPPRFCKRLQPSAIPLNLSQPELTLAGAFDSFRTKVREVVATGEKRRERAGSFAVEILGKRLLSCPTSFAESWRRCKEGLQGADTAAESEVTTAERSVHQETGDDREAESREAMAVTVVGSWMKAIAPQLTAEIAAIDASLNALGFVPDGASIPEKDPKCDARFAALTSLIDDLLRTSKGWKSDERLLVFTEYKTTLDYIARRLREHYREDGRILTLYGGMDDTSDKKSGYSRKTVKDAFNDPNAEVRILVATDAASEGLNLQRTARYLLHFDCPWNPSKIEQRNGRVDRHGQARDVTVHYFVSDQDQDLRFLAHVLQKADDIREDLGSTNEIFDDAVHRRLIGGESFALVKADLDKRVEAARGRTSMDADTTIASIDDTGNAAVKLEALAADLDLDPGTLRDTLEAALAIRGGRPQFESGSSADTYHLKRPDLPGWTDVIDDTVRISRKGNTLGAMPQLAFSVEPFLEQVGSRRVFSPRKDLLLMHLSHPLMQKALSLLIRRRYPQSGEEVSRWSVRLGGVPDGADALLLLTVEEMAVNNLREAFHHWVHTIAVPVSGDKLAEPLPHRPARNLTGGSKTTDQILVSRTQSLLDELLPNLKDMIAQRAEQLSGVIKTELASAGEEARRSEEERYRSRQGEISTLIAETSIAKLEREVAELKAQRSQGFLFEQSRELERLDRSIDEKTAEITRRKEHYEEVRRQLESERTRILQNLLPNRFTMAGPAQVFPVCIEVRLPDDRRVK